MPPSESRRAAWTSSTSMPATIARRWSTTSRPGSRAYAPAGSSPATTTSTGTSPHTATSACARRSTATSRAPASECTRRSRTARGSPGSCSSRSGSIARQHLAVDLVELVEVTLERLDQLVPALPDRAVESHHLARIGDHPRHDLRQLRAAARAVEPPGLAGDRVVGDPTARVPDHRDALGQQLEAHEREGLLPDRGDDAHVGPVEHRPDLLGPPVGATQAPRR